MKRKRKYWKAEEIAWLVKRYPDERAADIAEALDRPLTSIYDKAAQLGLSKSAAFMVSDRSGRILRGRQCPAMIAARFKPGHQSWNKGMKGLDLSGGKGSRFKPGEKPKNWKPVGSERMSKGFLQRKMTDTGYPPRDWVPVHHLVWAEHYGPIPVGHVVVFRDGDRRNFALGNLALITRRELMQRNSLHTNYPPEIIEVIQLRGTIKRQLNRHLKKGQHHEK